MASSVSFRRATLADRNGVLAIDPMLFDGLDYMPAMYTTILQDPAYRPYVAVTADGNIVSFMALMVDKELGFYCGVSGRTKEDYKGQRINVNLRMRAMADLKAECGTQFEQLVVASDKPHVYTQRFWSDPEKYLIQRNVFLVYVVPVTKIVNTEEACRRNPRITSIPIEKLDPDRAFQVMTEQYAMDYVLRKSHLIAFCNSLPFPKCQKYLKRIASQCNVFASFKANSDRPNGISYSSLIRGPVHVNVNIYLSVYEHVDVLLAHLLQHLTHITRVVPRESTVGIRIDFPAEIDKCIVKDIINPTMGVNRIGKVHPMEYHLMWKEAPSKTKANL